MALQSHHVIESSQWRRWLREPHLRLLKPTDSYDGRCFKSSQKSCKHTNMSPLQHRIGRFSTTPPIKGSNKCHEFQSINTESPNTLARPHASHGKSPHFQTPARRTTPVVVTQRLRMRRQCVFARVRACVYVCVYRIAFSWMFVRGIRVTTINTNVSIVTCR